jgi:SET domain-containing protein
MPSSNIIARGPLQERPLKGGVNRSNGTRQKRGVRGRSNRIEVRDSGVHGRGVFVTKPIRKGGRIIEYTGKRMPWEEASGDSDDSHTFLFGLEDDDRVINAGIGGNESRWINHSCGPNCEAIEDKGRVFIYALRNLRPGEELFYDYALELDEPRTKKLEQRHACHCGAPRCRGTLLAPRKSRVAR